MASKIRRYGSAGASVDVQFLDGPSWRKAVGSQKELNTINREAIRAGALWWQQNAIPSRFDNDTVRGAPFRASNTTYDLFVRALASAKRGVTPVGTIPLQRMLDTVTMGWNPWTNAPPPADLASWYRRAFMASYRSASGQNTTLFSNLRRWAKDAVRKKYAASNPNAFPAITMTGTLASVAGTGKVRATATGKASKATVTIPRKDRQNDVVRHIFGGSGRSAIITADEMRQIAQTVGQYIIEAVTGAGSTTKRLQRGAARAAAKQDKASRKRATAAAIAAIRGGA